MMQQATYKPNPNEKIVVGENAFVDVVQHPTCSNCTVRTTAVKEYDEATGVFITDNTVFTPVFQDAASTNEPVPEPLAVAPVEVPAAPKPIATKGAK